LWSKPERESQLPHLTYRNGVGITDARIPLAPR
jgi:hypothetical protein